MVILNSLFFLFNPGQIGLQFNYHSVNMDREGSRPRGK